MTSKTMKIVITRQLPAPIETRMSELFDATLNESDDIFSPQDLVKAMQVADILVPTVTDKITGEMLKQAGSQLKLIANFGNGVDNIDVEMAYEKGIAVTNTPSVLTEDTADMTLALLLALPRRMLEGDRIMRQAGRFTGWSPNWMLGRELAGKTLGIVGMGRIGQAVAKRAKVFGINIVYHNRNRLHADTEKVLQARYYKDLDEMLPQLDFLSLHCPHTEETTQLIDTRRLALLPPHAYLINTSRGRVVDETALADALADNKLAGAGLDVFEHEPQVNPRLLDFERVILLPHMSSATLEGRIRMGEKVLVNIRAFMDGHRPPDRVLPRSDNVVA